MVFQLQEAMIARANSRKGWRETAEKNFMKSLDHQLFYFKKQEKVLYTPASFNFFFFFEFFVKFSKIMKILFILFRFHKGSRREKKFIAGC